MEGPQWTGPDRPDRPAVARPAVARPARTGPDYPCICYGYLVSKNDSQNNSQQSDTRIRFGTESFWAAPCDK